MKNKQQLEKNGIVLGGLLLESFLAACCKEPNMQMADFAVNIKVIGS